MRPTYRCKNRDGTTPRNVFKALDGWVYFYDVGAEELAKLRKDWDVVQLARAAMPEDG